MLAACKGESDTLIASNEGSFVRKALLLGCFDSDIISMVSSSSESCLSYSDDEPFNFIGVGSGSIRLSFNLGGAGTVGADTSACESF